MGLLDKVISGVTNTVKSFEAKASTPTSSPPPATATPNFGTSSASSFATAEAGKPTDPWIMGGVTTLEPIKNDSPEAKRVYEILSRNGIATKEELKELNGDASNPGLLKQLEGQLDAGQLKSVNDAASMKQVVRGFLDWVQQQSSKQASFGTPVKFF